MAGRQTDRQTDGQADSFDRQEGKQANSRKQVDDFDRQADRQTDRRAVGQAGRRTCRLEGRWMD